MPILWLLLIVLALGAIGYLLGVRRAVASAGGDTRKLHSLPSYYGSNVFLATVIPALMLMAAWLLLQPVVIEAQISPLITAEAEASERAPDLVLADVRRLADGLNDLHEQNVLDDAEIARLNAGRDDVRGMLGQVGIALGADVAQPVLDGARDYRNLWARYSLAMSIVVLGAAALGFIAAIRNTHVDFRARNVVERAIKALLILASTIAILTTVGIVMSMLLETRNFFGQYNWTDFFFGTTWAPSFSGRGGASELGILPLLWGTLYISFIALIVAVPIGLFAAIYLSEYAGPKMRAWAKPAIEVLAGIPTIVYGLFALITVGPMLRDYFAQPLGLGDSSASVMTAGLVMGIMLIPFVSSLSDDIINAVPQSMRDGSLGLGATKSETIKQVVVPAALPGIVGAVLLAASRAIGETMIVVLGAGAAAKISGNPFEAMTTVTVKIVSQLTGDTDFASPETLVAFALGLTLFVLTLGLNILALYVVRKYREQYE
ncbi:phosphate ABC transporter permease subunit PstC [Rhodovulum sp. FJ3]|uniref:phosphate ABC transporter permease subunit PstC n=1 Tax=Rhodovulum sp. FJ3 TaxID=3079053 RepID=UPI00293DCF13|nr:phosphate ABC transporter permease subunit PstC [Rhodovulum sp. FJ3]MDV4167985.1 phosphate ABC transporter permease subunit PstC [Rhodovulum sp. FJ3]